MNQFFKKIRKDLTILGLFFIVWRIALFVWSIAAPQFLPYQPSFPYAYTLLPSYELPQWVYSWANFDGVHYLTIADRGYEAAALIQAFFPLFPLLVTVASFLIGNTVIAGLIVSNLALIACLLILFLLIKETYGKSVAMTSVVVMLLFPVSFFFGALYSESLFLLLVLLVFYALHKKQWVAAGIFIALASATRIVGIFLLPAALLELFFDTQPSVTLSIKTFRSFILTRWKEVLSISIGVVGLGCYMLYLYVNYDDPLYFWHVQSEFGAGREEGIILLPQVIWRYIKILSTVPISSEWFIYLQELIYGVVPLLLIAYYWLKKKVIKPSWAVFSMCALLLPTFTGTFSSMPRYTLVAFPLYILIASPMKSRSISGIILTVSGILLLLNLLLFIQGYWVA